MFECLSVCAGAGAFLLLRPSIWTIPIADAFASLPLLLLCLPSFLPCLCVFSQEKFLHDRIKIAGKTGVLGEAIQITRDASTLTVTSKVHISKRYLKVTYTHSYTHTTHHSASSPPLRSLNTPLRAPFHSHSFFSQRPPFLQRQISRMHARNCIWMRGALSAATVCLLSQCDLREVWMM